MGKTAREPGGHAGHTCDHEDPPREAVPTQQRRDQKKHQQSSDGGYIMRTSPEPSVRGVEDQAPRDDEGEPDRNESVGDVAVVHDHVLHQRLDPVTGRAARADRDRHNRRRDDKSPSHSVTRKWTGHSGKHDIERMTPDAVLEAA